MNSDAPPSTPLRRLADVALRDVRAGWRAIRNAKGFAVTVVATLVVFAIAMPLRIAGDGDASTYIRNAVPVATGTPASDNVNAPGLYPKITSGVGTAPAFDGTIRTEPDVSPGATAATTSFCELRGATVYGAPLAAVPSIFTVTAAAGVLADPGPRNCTFPV